MCNIYIESITSWNLKVIWYFLCLEIQRSERRSPVRLQDAAVVMKLKFYVI